MGIWVNTFFLSLFVVFNFIYYFFLPYSSNDNINSGYTDSRRVRYQVETFAKVIDSQTQKVAM